MPPPTVCELTRLESGACVQSHHESALPAQRYKNTRLLPHKLNPIVPQDVSSYGLEGGE